MDRWYAVFTKRHREARARLNLIEQGYRVFYPEVEKTIKHGPKHMHRIERRPMFDRYLFVQMDLDVERCAPINSTDCVDHLLCTALERPIPVRRGDVEKVQAILRESGGVIKLNKTGDRPQFKEGQTLRVISGPFTSFNGPVKRIDENSAVIVVDIDLFGRPTPVELTYEDVEVAA